MWEILTHLDGNILLFIQRFIRNDIFTPFFVNVTKLGNAGFIWIVLSILLLFSKKTRRVGSMGLCALFLSLIVNNVLLKNLVARTRPFDALQMLAPLIQKPTDFSFPSGHTGASFAAAIVFFRNLPRRFGVPALFLAICIAVSRLYIGVHYPTDVLGGLFIGIVLGLFAEKIVFAVERKAAKRA